MRRRNSLALLAITALIVMMLFASVNQGASPISALQAPTAIQEVLGTKPVELPRCASAGKLKVGTDATYPPFESVNETTGKVEGFDIDLVSAIALKEGFSIDVHNALFDTIFTALSYGQYDIVISAATITTERQRVLSFSSPYFVAGQVTVVRKTDIGKIEGPDDLAGRTVGVQLGATGEQVTKGIKNIKAVKLYGTAPEAFQALAEGRLDAVVNDNVTSLSILLNSPDLNLAIVGQPFAQENYGIAVRKDCFALLAKINQGLAQVITDGTYEQFYTKYLGAAPPDAFRNPKATKTATPTPLPSATATRTSTPVPPTAAPSATAVTGAALFDLSTASLYKAPNDEIEIKLPKGWSLLPSSTLGRYEFIAGQANSPTASVQVVIDDPASLYSNYFQLTEPVKGPKEALQALGKNAPPDGSVTFSETLPARIGNLAGFAMTIKVKASAQGPAQVVELRLAALSSNKVVFVGIQAGPDVWAVGHVTLDKMVDTLVVKAGNLPTATASNTPHPLELTLTAVQQLKSTVEAQIQSLTPSHPTTRVPTTAPGADGNVSAAADNGQSPCLGVADPTTNPPAGGSAKQWAAPDNVVHVTHTYCAIIKTDKGRIVAELFAAAAPKNVNSFVFLAQQGFYDGLTWHRVIPGFVAQTGDPTGIGSGGPGYNNLPLETSPTLKYDRAGRIGMARTSDPNSAGSQFFITFGPQPSLDQGGYTIIGQVVQGMEVVRQLTPRDLQAGTGAETGDKLISIRIVDVTAQ